MNHGARERWTSSNQLVWKELRIFLSVTFSCNFRAHKSMNTRKSKDSRKDSSKCSENERERYFHCFNALREEATVTFRVCLCKSMANGARECRWNTVRNEGNQTPLDCILSLCRIRRILMSATRRYASNREKEKRKVCFIAHPWFSRRFRVVRQINQKILLTIFVVPLSVLLVLLINFTVGLCLAGLLLLIVVCNRERTSRIIKRLIVLHVDNIHRRSMNFYSLSLFVILILSRFQCSFVIDGISLNFDWQYFTRKRQKGRENEKKLNLIPFRAT